jgi:hypothetical protein
LESAERLPGDPAGLLPLDAQQLVSLHPIDETAFRRLRIERDYPLGGDIAGSRHALQYSRGGGDSETSPFLQDGLLEMPSRNSHLSPDGDQFVRGERFADFAFGGLQLGRAPDDPLESGAVDPGG